MYVCLTCVVFLNDVHHLACGEVHLVGVLPLVVGQHSVLLQVLHLIRVRDDGL